MPRKKRDWTSSTAAGIKVPPDRCVVVDNPRTRWDPEAFEELKADIRLNGVLDPIEGFLLDDRAEITDGQRRLEAVRELAEEGHRIEWLRFNPVPGNRVEAIIRGLSRTGTREQLSVVDEIGALEMLEAKGLDELDELVRRLPWSESKVRQRIALRQLAEPLREALRAGEFTHNRALQLADLSEPEQADALEKIREKAAGGQARAGTSTPKQPGKRVVRKLVTEYQEAGAETVTRDDVAVVLSWVAGDCLEADARKALGLSAEPAAPNVDPRQQPLPGTGGDALGDDPEARREAALATFRPAGAPVPPARPGRPAGAS
jgi:ParB-like chromosome segregation protein Spo0J